MEPRSFWVTKSGMMWAVFHTVANSKPHHIATFLQEGQAMMLASTLNDLDQKVEQATTLMRRQRSQLQTVGNALFALVREVLVTDGPPVEITCSPQFPRRWHEAMELLLVLAAQGIPTA